MSNKIRQAICCTCGAIRTCQRPRNHQHENYWLIGQVDRNWHRELGDLKCANCGQVTRHAILHPDGDSSFRDHAERITRIALGGSDSYTNAYPALRDRVRAAYRQGRQANPYLNHMWSASDAEAARKAGKTTVMTYCGEVETIPEKSKSVAAGQLLKPADVRWDDDYEDPETGSWWIEMDCPDCLRFVNDHRMAARRSTVKLGLAWLLHDLANRLPDEHVEALAEVIERVAGGAYR